MIYNRASILIVGVMLASSFPSRSLLSVCGGGYSVYIAYNKMKKKFFVLFFCFGEEITM